MYLRKKTDLAKIRSERVRSAVLRPARRLLQWSDDKWQGVDLLKLRLVSGWQSDRRTSLIWEWKCLRVFKNDAKFIGLENWRDSGTICFNGIWKKKGLRRNLSINIGYVDLIWPKSVVSIEHVEMHKENLGRDTNRHWVYVSGLEMKGLWLRDKLGGELWWVVTNVLERWDYLLLVWPCNLSSIT